MVSDVLVNVREDQQKLKHPVPLAGIGLARSFFEVLDDRQRIRKQPFHALWVGGNTAAAAVERLIRSQESFVEEMVEAELLAGESHRDRSCARKPQANSGYGAVHSTPHTLGAGTPSEELGETSTYFPPGKCCASKCAMANPADENRLLKGICYRQTTAERPI